MYQTLLYIISISILLSGCQVKPTPSSEVDQSQGATLTEVTEQADDITPTATLGNAIMDDTSVWRLVNKTYGLSPEDVPQQLRTVKVPHIPSISDDHQLQMQSEAADHLEYLFDAAADEEIVLYAASGFRSYDTQAQIYHQYVSDYGEVEASRFSALPGHSEHQTGLAMDVTSQSVQYELTRDFFDTVEGKWVADNAHRFGFVIRYPEGKEAITGYMYEPWHLRYLGQTLAQTLYDHQLTYEEYLAHIGVEF